MEVNEERRGFLLGVTAYVCWGVFPLYWALLEPAGAVEILAHRICWSLVTMVGLTLLFLIATGAVLVLVGAAFHSQAKRARGADLSYRYVQSRIDTVRDYVESHARVGNFYVNRNQIGAVVESQPFGGEGLSGTGPKAGGPHYVARFATERVTCIDTTAAGGNASLMAALEG